MDDRYDDQSEAGTHGFLFADLRGYAQLVDTRSARGASLLLGRYRTIIRDVVARHGGAEIKTEGDSFYLVLPSASVALRCGLDILAACRKRSTKAKADRGWSRHPRRGVGGARRRLRRLGGQHRRSDMRRRRRWPRRASGTIRELTRSIVAAQFVSVGRRQLKGLAEPVELFKVVPDGASSLAPRRPRQAVSAARPVLWLAVAAVVIGVIATGVLAATLWRLASGPSVASSSAGPTASPGRTEGQLAASPSVPIERLPPGGLVQPGTYAPNRNGTWPR